MPNKSHVSIEQNACKVCGKPYDTGAILLDKRMRESLDKNTITGWGLCSEHQELADQDYIAMVAVDERKSDKLPNGNITPAGAWRIGPIAHITREVFSQIFDTDPEGHEVMFCELGVIQQLEAMSQGAK